MTSVPDGMSIADAKRLLVVGEDMFKCAHELPDPLQPLAIRGTDALCLTPAARTAEVEEIG